MSESDQDPQLPQLVVREQDQGDIYADPAAFRHWWRVAQMFASSGLLPEHLRKQVPDVLIGLDLARRLQVNPLTVLQNLYVVKGTPGWKTQFLVALANGAGWDLEWETEKPGASADPDFKAEKPRLEWQRSTKSGTVGVSAPNMRTRCIMERGGKRKVGIWVSLGQAVAAKWADNEQYVHSTQNQLEWRAAAFAIRKYDPNLTLGLPTAEEAADERLERVQLVGEETVVEPAATRGPAAVRQAVRQPTPTPTATEAPKVEPPPPKAQAEPAPTTTAKPPDPSSSSPAPSSTPQETAEEGDQAAGKGRVPKPNAVLEADMIMAGLVTQPRGKKIPIEICKRALREGLGAKQLGEDRVMSALNFGVTRKMWELVSDNGFPVGIILPGQASSAPSTPAAEQAAPAPSGGDLPDTPAELEQLIADVEYALGDTPADLATEAGLPVTTDGEVITDGAPVEALQRYLLALRKRQAETVSE